MIRHSKKLITIFLIVATVLLCISTVFALTLNINLIDTVRQYLEIISNNNVQTSSEQLEAAKNTTVKNILDYITQYKTDITDELDTYTQQEIQENSNNFQQYYDDIRAELDGNKDQLLEEYKDKIKKDIDKQKDIIEKELQKDIEDGIKDIFK